MRKFRKIVTSVILGAIACASFVPLNAEELDTDLTKYPTIDRDTANLTIKYFDDSDETIPITGAEFTVMKVADIGRDITDGTNGKYLPLDDEIDFTKIEEKSDDDAYKYEQKVISYYEENPNAGYTKTMVINANGYATYTLPVGAYLVRETSTTRYHVRSKPFLVSVPETNEESNSWNFDVVVYPKQIIAGDLNIEKKLIGKSSSYDNVFHVTVNLSAEGSYKAKLADGTESTVKDGDVLTIKGNQSITIYDVPTGTDYKVTEVEANVDPYLTGYKNQEGKIEPKTEVKVTVINDTTQWDNVHTGTGSYIIIAMMIGGGALALLIYLLASGKHKKETAE